MLVSCEFVDKINSEKFQRCRRANNQTSLARNIHTIIQAKYCNQKYMERGPYFIYRSHQVFFSFFTHQNEITFHRNFLSLIFVGNTVFRNNIQRCRYTFLKYSHFHESIPSSCFNLAENDHDFATASFQHEFPISPFVMPA